MTVFYRVFNIRHSKAHTHLVGKTLGSDKKIS